MSNLEQLLRELRCDIKKDSEQSLKIVEERITKNINENIDEKFENIHCQIELIKKNSFEHSERILAIEKHIRYRNLIFFAVEEGEKSYEELENKILHIVTTDMKIDCNRSEIEIVKRMGKKTENKIRPIVVTFSTYGKKSQF
ncbi:jg22367 [Pararge aegeria aegeria]|uniref:Jg22367 protein n=1 Tax=Pararge aegeria aegeria TaxID=348720 RepID=A0A8S4RGY6_9NEOP|nr:jg22367 [Pararge aegeria aegeria]